MENQLSFLTTQFITLNDFLSNLVELFPHPVYVKDAHSGKYLFCNQTNFKIYKLGDTSFSSSSIEQNFESWMRPLCMNGYAELAAKLNRQALLNKHYVQDKCVVVTSAGSICVQELVTIPIFGANREVVAMFTFSYDLTSEMDLFCLFNLYLYYYSKKQAILPFLKYLAIDNFFHQYPTEAEVLILLAMRNDDSHKYVANFLQIEPKTVEAHRSHLRRKLKDANLNKLLIFLRKGLKNIESHH